MQIRNSRGDLKLAENCTTDGKGDCAHRKMNRPLKTMENRKKDYTNGGKRAIIYQLKYAHQPDLRMRRCQEGGGDCEAEAAKNFPAGNAAIIGTAGDRLFRAAQGDAEST